MSPADASTQAFTGPGTPGLVLQGLRPPLALQDYRLIAFDMDSTLINIECIDEIADAVGRKAEVAALTEAAMRGEIADYKDSLRQRVAFGKPLLDNQFIQYKLAELKTEIEALRAELTKRTNELSFVTAATNGLDQRINAIDSRLSNMTSELTHQLHELGNEIQTISEQQQDPASVAALEQLRVNTTRIANEQARYEIAFRQDLATLAEMLRRPQ